jgi:hypothetical protein
MPNPYKVLIGKPEARKGHFRDTFLLRRIDLILKRELNV